MDLDGNKDVLVNDQQDNAEFIDLNNYNIQTNNSQTAFQAQETDPAQRNDTGQPDKISDNNVSLKKDNKNHFFEKVPPDNNLQNSSQELGGGQRVYQDK